MILRPRLPLILVGSCVLAPTLGAQSRLLTQGQVIAEPGDAPTGLAANELLGTSTAVETGCMNRTGRVVFRGRLVGPSVTALNDRALFVGHTKGDMRVLVRANNPEPTGVFPNSVMVAVSSTTGMPSSSAVFATPRISSTGLVMFGSQLYDGGNPGLDGLIHTSAFGTINDSVLFWGVPGALQILAQKAATAMPGGAVLNGTWSGTSNQYTGLNAAGLAVFSSSLLGGDVVGTTNDTAWIWGTPGNLTYMMREGDAVASVGGATIANINPLTAPRVAMNDLGAVLHDEKLNIGTGTPAVTANDDTVVFVSVGGAHFVLMREGDLAPDAAGTPMPGVFYGPTQAAAVPLLANGFSNTNMAAFATTLTGAVSTTNDFAWFVGAPGNVRLVAREGDAVPGTGGETIAAINPNANFAEATGVVFGATLDTPGLGGVTVNNDSVLCIARPGNLALIVREGAPVPGLAGFVFGNMSGSANFSTTMRANERGQVLWNGQINNGTTDRNALFSYDPTHGVQLQLMATDTLAAGTVSTPASINPFAGSDGNPLGFNDDGDFVTTATLAASAGAVMLRGHIGSLEGRPSAFAATGGTQNFALDCTPARASQFYAILASTLGTRPGFLSPLGPQTVALNFDPTWTQLSLSLANTPVWTNTLSLTDAAGKATASFTLPPGLPGLQGLNLHHAAVLFDFTLVSTFVTEPVPCHLY